ncbi:MAG TPA: tetratricopeptide repeat protein, partial [Thermoanaerobaculia bacterium]
EHAAELKIDPKRIALWACSANSRLGTALVANHTDFRAAVFYYGLMEAAPKNDVTPVLVARAGLDALTLNDSIDRWVAGAVALDAPVTLLTYPEGRHAFDVDQDTVESKRVIEQTLDFLKHHLTTGPTPRIEPMSMSQLQRLVREEGHTRAIATLESFRKTRPKAYVLEEQALNSLGYSSLQQNKPDAAIAFLELATKLYPNSANAHDSLGDAYEAAGRTADAIASAERALQLVDQAPPPRRDGIRQRAEAKLKRLKS